MDMQYIGMKRPRLEYGKGGVDNSLDAFTSRGIYIEQFYTTVLAYAVVVGDVGTATYHGDIMTHRREARIKFLAMGLDPSEYAGDAACACYYYFHGVIVYRFIVCRGRPDEGLALRHTSACQDTAPDRARHGACFLSPIARDA